MLDVKVEMLCVFTTIDQDALNDVCSILSKFFNQ